MLINDKIEGFLLTTHNKFEPVVGCVVFSGYVGHGAKDDAELSEVE